LPEVISEDVVSCVGKAKVKSEEWQSQHKDYLVIATKCAKEEGSATTPPSPSE